MLTDWLNVFFWLTESIVCLNNSIFEKKKFGQIIVLLNAEKAAGPMDYPSKFQIVGSL